MNVTSILYKQGDLLSAPEQVIAHGVNCKGVFNAGIAKQIREKYPHAYKAYKQKYKEEGWCVGDCQLCTHSQKIIFNLAIQDGYGRTGCFVDYDGLRLAFLRMLRYCAEWSLQSIAIPKIGAGLAGGDWDIIEQIINEEVTKYNILTVTVYYK